MILINLIKHRLVIFVEKKQHKNHASVNFKHKFIILLNCMKFKIKCFIKLKKTQP